MTSDTLCSPGNHPHTDQPNWRPAETIGEYLVNCGEGLEEFSERRAAKFLGVSRAKVQRWLLMAKIPDDLFDLLLKGGPGATTTSLANVGAFLSGDANMKEIERCQHCSGILRVRPLLDKRVRPIVEKWLRERAFPKGEVPP